MSLRNYNNWYIIKLFLIFIMKIISSSDNPLIKQAWRLKKSVFRRKQAKFLVDGQREIKQALNQAWSCSALFYNSELATEQNSIFDFVANDKIIKIPKNLFFKLCYKEKPDGFLAIFEQKEIEFSDIKLSTPSLILVLDNVEKPGNLGAIIRTAQATGVEAIIVNQTQTDIYNPNVIRASEGYVFSLPIIKTTVEQTVEWLKQKKIKSFGALTTANKSYLQVDFKGSVAIILGSEAKGLSLKWINNLDQSLVIPMFSSMDSLNVSVAAGVILYEVLRQRLEN